MAAAPASAACCGVGKAARKASVERRALLPLAEQAESCRVDLLEASGQLVDQTGLLLDEALLVAREHREFPHQVAIRDRAAQLTEFAAAQARERVGVQRVGLGPGGLAQCLEPAGVDGVEGQARLHERGDEQAPRRLDEAGEVLGVLGNVAVSAQPVDERVQSLWAVGDAQVGHPIPLRVDEHDVVVALCPVATRIPHDGLSSLDSLRFHADLRLLG
jgi:hypothetical protein